MDVKISAAREKDFDIIISLLLDMALLHSRGRPDLFTDGHAKYTKEELREIANNPATPVFVAAGADDEALGYVFCQIRTNSAKGPFKGYKSLYVDDLCVCENRRGEGIGTKLLEHAVEYAKKNGCVCVELNVWECNKGAIAFYEKFGMCTKKRTMELIL